MRSPLTPAEVDDRIARRVRALHAKMNSRALRLGDHQRRLLYELFQTPMTPEEAFAQLPVFATMPHVIKAFGNLAVRGWIKRDPETRRWHALEIARVAA